MVGRNPPPLLHAHLVELPACDAFSVPTTSMGVLGTRRRVAPRLLNHAADGAYLTHTPPWAERTWAPQDTLWRGKAKRMPDWERVRELDKRALNVSTLGGAEGHAPHPQTVLGKKYFWPWDPRRATDLMPDAPPPPPIGNSQEFGFLRPWGGVELLIYHSLLIVSYGLAMG